MTRNVSRKNQKSNSNALATAKNDLDSFVSRYEKINQIVNELQKYKENDQDLIDGIRIYSLAMNLYLTYFFREYFGLDETQNEHFPESMIKARKIYLRKLSTVKNELLSQHEDDRLEIIHDLVTLTFTMRSRKMGK